MNIKIEKGIKMWGSWDKSKYSTEENRPYRKMKAGDSFYLKVSVSNLVMSSKRWAKRNKPKWRFVVRRDKKGARIWRTK